MLCTQRISMTGTSCLNRKPKSSPKALWSTQGIRAAFNIRELYAYKALNSRRVADQT